jgi:ABC-2 type transport system permease protein
MSDLATVYRVTGPAAPSDDPRRFWHLTLTLARMDWKVRFFGSALGYVWSLLRPLLLFGILYFVFSEVVGAGDGIEHYPIVLLSGMMLYFFFAEVTGAASTSLVDREALVRKVGFPRMVVPLAVALVGVFNLLLNLVVLAIFLVLNGATVRWTWLLVPIPLILVGVLATSTGMLLAALYVRFRDIKPIWDVFLQALFYATPILYPIQLVQEKSETLTHVLMASPLASLIQGTRHLLLGNDTPSAATAIGGTAWLLVPAAILVVVTVLGFWVFERTAPGAAEEL